MFVFSTQMKTSEQPLWPAAPTEGQYLGLQKMITFLDQVQEL